MPRFPDYWAKRMAGLCVECPTESREFARCEKCRLRRQGNRQYWAGAVREGRKPRLIASAQTRKTPALAADEAIAKLSREALQLLVTTYERRHCHEDDEREPHLQALAKAGLVYRDPDGYATGPSKWWVPSPLGAWAAKRVIEGTTTVDVRVTRARP